MTIKLSTGWKLRHQTKRVGIASSHQVNKEKNNSVWGLRQYIPLYHLGSDGTMSNNREVCCCVASCCQARSGRHRFVCRSATPLIPVPASTPLMRRKPVQGGLFFGGREEGKGGAPHATGNGTSACPLLALVLHLD
jgi:hypothetical protein